MTTAAEAAAAKTPLGAALDAGIAAISYGQEIVFTLYLRTVLPVDGFVFWVRAGATKMSVKGSLHFGTLMNQVEADSAATNTVIFTAREPVQDLDAVAPNKLWVAEFGGAQFAFRERHMFYQQSGTYHYRGTALYSTIDTQLVNSAADLPELVVSNSLPLWLMMNQFAPVYPSFAVPTNLSPPYIAVHIPPSETESFALAPYIDPATSSSWELCRDTVKFTFYGLPNDAVIRFKNAVFDGSMADGAPYGILGNRLGAVQDEKHTQVEMQVLAQQKTWTISASYYQAQLSAIAQKYILSAIMTITFSPNIP